MLETNDFQSLAPRVREDGSEGLPVEMWTGMSGFAPL
jgi:hypothetical protein